MFIAEVTETRRSFKPDQKDDQGNPLPLGSIEIRIGNHQSNLGQVRNVFARPMIFNRRIPLIGEQVLVISTATNDWSSSGTKGIGFMYFCPVNGTDDLAFHKFPRLWKRRGLVKSNNPGERKSDKEESGYSFPDPPKKVENIQPFEGDDLYEGRTGHSIRFGSTVKGDMSVYSKKPTWEGSGNGDPILYIRVAKPTGGNTTSNSTTTTFQSNNKYTIEDLDKDDSSLVLTSNQKLKNFKAGFDKNKEAKKIGQFDGKSQVAVDAARVVLNAKKDMLLLIGKEKAILTGKKVILQSDKYNVDLDVLMDWLRDFEKACEDIASAKATLATPAGPSGISTNLSDFIQLSTTKFNKFKQP